MVPRNPVNWKRLVLACACLCIPAIAMAKDTHVLQPVPLPPDYAEGKNLKPLGSWPADMVIKPFSKNDYASWYVGSDISSSVAQLADGKLQLRDTPFDEHVHVLEGTAILTSADGKVHTFHKGSTFIVPKHWTGTWEVKGNFREEMTFYTKSLNEAMKKFFAKK
jgi:hypothetical protein